ncbi:MAG TPA: hypothetical protein VFJ14_04670 [Nocardioidaceae bacterium]|nr:hypothetical protein [Nocardioidaceae bacterium]
MSGALRRGLLAGAVGTLALNAATYLDMALRGRSGSDTPGRTIEAAIGALDGRVPGKGAQHDNRRTAFGALSGMGVGLGVGVGASMARSAGLRLPRPIAAVATGAAAMAASDLPAAALGVTDPREWSGADWASDIAPHLAYGIATHAAIRHLDKERNRGETPPTRPSAGLLLRSTALGVATGSRSSLGLAGVVISTPSTPLRRWRAVGRTGTSVATLMLGGELAADKHPAVPDRLEKPALPMRLVSGSGGGAALAAREHATIGLPMAAGALGAAAGSYGGAAWREIAASRMPDWQAALIEDGVALALAAAACLPGRRSTRR